MHVYKSSIRGFAIYCLAVTKDQGQVGTESQTRKKGTLYGYKPVLSRFQFRLAWAKILLYPISWVTIGKQPLESGLLNCCVVYAYFSYGLLRPYCLCRPTDCYVLSAYITAYGWLSPECLCRHSDCCVITANGLLSPECLCRHSDCCFITANGLLFPECLCRHSDCCVITANGLLSPECLCRHSDCCFITANGLLFPECLCRHSDCCVITTSGLLSPECLCRHSDLLGREELRRGAWRRRNEF